MKERRCPECGKLCNYNHNTCGWECSNPRCAIIRFHLKPYRYTPNYARQIGKVVRATVI